MRLLLFVEALLGQWPFAVDPFSSSVCVSLRCEINLPACSREINVLP